MFEPVFLGIGLLIGAGLGWILGARKRRTATRAQLTLLLEAVESGDLTAATGELAEDLPEARRLQDLLKERWVPRTLAREQALREALKRLHDYLRHRVEAPLLAGLEADGDALRGGADAALDAVEDLAFFLEPPPVAPALETRNLVDLVGEVTAEFSGQFKIYVKVEGPQEPFRAQVDPDPLKDAIFLILHNAGEFGGGRPVQMILRKEQGRIRILIQDQGPGFSGDGLAQALSPFYSTSPGGLGLGLPHARMVVRAQGGDVILRNREEGGGEVEILLPRGS